MIFNITVKSGEKKIYYKPLSISLKYMIDEKKIKESLNNIGRVFNVRLSELQKKTFLSKEGNTIYITKYDGKPDELILSKVKIDDKFSADSFRNDLAGFIPKLASREMKNLHIFIPKYEPFKKYFDTEEYFYQTFIEGVLFGNYTFDNYISEKKRLKPLTVLFYADNSKKLRKAIETAQNVMEGVSLARDLANEPGIALTPVSFARRLGLILPDYGVKVKVFNEKEIKKRKMGGLTAVGMGSENPPRFIVLEYKGAASSGKKKSKRIALVGKGITFDSGGISIKPSSKMGEMKADMAGAATVAGTVLAAAKAALPINVTGIIPAAENMPSGKSFRPGDIIVTASGKTIEVDDTDAEGRVVLADALDYASKIKPDAIVDLATLTGACVVALGEFVAGLFTKNDELSKTLYDAGMKTYDRVWALPMWDDFHQLNKSDVADVKNLGGRWGGAISAAKFLENFVDKDIPWAHLDIAGPSTAHSLNNYNNKYMTGFGVRLLFEYLSK